MKDRCEKKRMILVGCGPGSPAFLTDAAREAVAAADMLVGSERLIRLFPDRPEARIVLRTDVDAVLDRMAAEPEQRRIAVLVSGDPGLCSFSRRVLDRFGPDQCHVVAGVSSIQAACAALGLDWGNARILSFHGRQPEIDPNRLRAEPLLVLLGGADRSRAPMAELLEALEHSHNAWLCADLTLNSERIQRLDAETLRDRSVAGLWLVVLVRREEHP